MSEPVEGLPPAAAEGDPGLALAAFRAEVARIAKLAADLEKAVDALAKQIDRLEKAPRLVLDLVARIRELASQVSGTPDPAVFLEPLEARARAAQDRAAARFGTELAATLREKLGEGHELRPTDDGFACSAIRIKVDAGAGRVHVDYARQSVLKNLKQDPEVVGWAVAEFLAGLEKTAFDPDAFLAQLAAAYRLGLAAAGKQPGELVDILAFHGHLTWVMQPDTFRREPTAKRFRDYPLYRFAHDLHLLRAARRFEVEGQKLELEVAVHDRAYGKSLWVPDDRGAGSYYQAIGLRKAKEQAS